MDLNASCPRGPLVASCEAATLPRAWRTTFEEQGSDMTTDRTLRTLVCLLGILVLAILAGAGAASAAPAGDLPPSISSDKADSSPGEVVVLTGARWQPDELVRVRVNDDAGSTWSRDVDLNAGA